MAEQRNYLQHLRNQNRRLKRKIKIIRIQEIVLLLLLCILALHDIISNHGRASTESGSFHVSDEREINQVEENFTDTDREYAWLLGHESMFPEDKVDSAKGNLGLIHFLYNYGTNEYTIREDASISDKECNEEIPLFMQWDERWGYDSYGSSVMGLTGCGPTCLAMVIDGLKQSPAVTPREVAEYAMENDYYLQGTGTKWGLFSDFSKMYDIICMDLQTDKERIFSELSKGNPVICSMGAGIFTTGGHFIVLAGVKDGKIMVNDPNNVELSSRFWDLEEFSDEIVNAWSFLGNSDK